jgi:hypothetical protein
LISGAENNCAFRPCLSSAQRASGEQLNAVRGQISGMLKKECALMEECVKGGYGIFADGKWYPFDAKGNTLAKALFEKSAKKDHIKATVEGMKHEGKILVEKLTEAE